MREKRCASHERNGKMYISAESFLRNRDKV